MENISIKNPGREITDLFSFKEWRQRIHLYDDVYSPGTRCEYEWDMCSLPADLSNKTFIDVGANDGMFAFLAEKKGAKTVTAVDLYVNNVETNFSMTNGWPIDRVSTIKKVKGSHIDVKACSIYNLHDLKQQFDVTFCGNVIAWLRDPLEALDQLCGVTSQKLIIREDISRVKGRPVLEFVNNMEFSGCNFNGNREFYIKYLKAKGFNKIEFIPIDEYKIIELRERDFNKYAVEKGVKIFTNPFSIDSFIVAEEPFVAVGTEIINGKCFLNRHGWIDIAALKVLPKMIPNNNLKKGIFKSKFKKNMLLNCTIIAER